MAILVGAGVIAVVATTGPGQAVIARLGLHKLRKGGAPPEDRAYLLRACFGDRDEVAARLDAVRRQYPNFDEAGLYRRAIRTSMNERPSADDVKPDGSP